MKGKVVQKGMVQYIFVHLKWSVAQERDDEKDMEGQEEQKEKLRKEKR